MHLRRLAIFDAHRISKELRWGWRADASFVQLFHQVVNLGLIVTSALMIWKSLMVVTNSESPVVVVLRFVTTASSPLPCHPTDCASLIMHATACAHTAWSCLLPGGQY